MELYISDDKDLLMLVAQTAKEFGAFNLPVDHQDKICSYIYYLLDIEKLANGPSKAQGFEDFIGESAFIATGLEYLEKMLITLNKAFAEAKTELELSNFRIMSDYIYDSWQYDFHRDTGELRPIYRKILKLFKNSRYPIRHGLAKNCLEILSK